MSKTKSVVIVFLAYCLIYPLLGKAALENNSLSLLYSYELPQIEFNYTVAWHPQEEALIAVGAGIERKVIIYHFPEFEIEMVLQYEYGISQLEWQPEGQLLAGNSDTIVIWDTKTGEQLSIFDKHSHPTLGFAWNPTGETIASMAGDEIFIWNVSTSRVIRTLDPKITLLYQGVERTYNRDYNVLAWSPDGKFLTGRSALGSEQVWDTETGEEIFRIEGWGCQGRAIAWSPNGEWIATDCLETARSDIFIIDAHTGQRIKVLEDTGAHGAIAALAWHPNSQYLASQTLNDEYGDTSVEIWDVPSEEVIATVEGNLIKGNPAGVGPFVDTLSWSPDGSLLAVTGEDNLLRIWEFHEPEAGSR